MIIFQNRSSIFYEAELELTSCTRGRMHMLVPSHQPKVLGNHADDDGCSVALIIIGIMTLHPA